MAVTYEPIATTTLSTTATSVVFSSIPSTYTDLIVVFTGQNTTATVAMTFECDINNDGGNNYSSTWIDMSANTGRGTNNNGAYIGSLSKTSTSWAVIQFMNYSNTSTYKTWMSRWGTMGLALTEQGGAIVGMWRNTGAINKLDFNRPAGESGTFDVGCTFTLYGIKAA